MAMKHLAYYTAPRPVHAQETTIDSTGRGMDSIVVSVVRQFAEEPGLNPGGAKVMGTDGICKYLPV